MTETDPLSWLVQWYAGECNGDWEQQYGVTIESLDNPGWAIKIDLKDTSVPVKRFAPVMVENSESDWHAFEIKEQAFFAYGDPSKLPFLIAAFRRYVETGRVDAG